MPDQFTETTSISWFTRIKGAIVGIFLGGLLLCVSFALLWWNEGRAVKTAQSLNEGAGLVESVPSDQVNPAMEGKLVHVSGMVQTPEELTDAELGVTAKVVKLRRNVEMYQWQEEQSTQTTKKLGGGEEQVTTYTYTQAWSPFPTDSSKFKEAAGHGNPAGFPIESQEWTVQQATVGAFTLSPSLLGRMGVYKELAASPETLKGGSSIKRLAPKSLGGGKLFIGANAATPVVGDARISFATVEAGPVSIVAQQSGHSFEPYQTSGGRTIELLAEGSQTAESMFQAARSQNTFLAWALRVAGFFLMFLGFRMMLNLLSVIADVIPFVGSLVGMGLSLVSLLAASVCSLATVAFAWLFYRPLLGGGLLMAAVALLIVMIRQRAAKGNAAPATISTPG